MGNSILATYLLVINIVQLKRKQMNFFLEINYNNKIQPKEQQQVQTKAIRKAQKGSKCRNKPKQKKAIQTINYHWNDTENKRYVNFLVEKRPIFDLTLQEKRKVKIHNQLSKYVKCRNSMQCRTHHQKMMENFGSVENIIRNYIHLLHQRNLLKFRTIESNLTKKQQELKLENKIQNINPQQYIFYNGDLESFPLNFEDVQFVQLQELIEYDFQ